MSQVLIQQYLNQLQDLRKASGTHRESVVREAFKDLLKGRARSHDLIFVPEYEIAAPAKDRRYVDGALVHTLRVVFGYRFPSRGRRIWLADDVAGSGAKLRSRSSVARPAAEDRRFSCSQTLLSAKLAAYDGVFEITGRADRKVRSEF